MRTASQRTIRRWFRDMMVGAAMFLTLPLITLGLPSSETRWALDEAIAGEVIATRAVELTAPPGPAAEWAVMAAAQLRPAATPLQVRRTTDVLILGLTFSLIVAFNLGFWRHLRRVATSSGRDHQGSR